MEKYVSRNIIISWLVIVAVLGAAMMWMTYRQSMLIEQQTKEQAHALFESIVLTRRWNADHGGVYVYKGPGDVSNPYLDDPDITDTKGRVYTLKNPALMTREISAIADKDSRFAFHITSLKLKNPENAPDPWERGALLRFEDGVKEVTESVDIGGKRYFRLMRPLFVEEACLRCHTGQGYMVGDVRGGISVTVPDDEHFAMMKRNSMLMAAVSIAIISTLFIVLYFFVWRMVATLSRQKLELQKLNEQKNRFLGMAAHDLRTPLTVMSGYAELVGLTESEGGREELVEGIQRSIGNMLALINNLLDITKIRSGRLDLDREKIDISELINDCSHTTGMLCEKKGIKLKLGIPADPVVVSIDRQRMKQVLDNLLSNACKFSRPGTVVSLGAKSEGGSLVMWVEDQGVGIDEREIASVFEEFKKTSSRPTGGETSHGLGLAIVKHMVELHGGRIEVKSRLGHGTRFVITLPLA